MAEVLVDPEANEHENEFIAEYRVTGIRWTQYALGAATLVLILFIAIPTLSNNYELRSTLIRVVIVVALAGFWSVFVKFPEFSVRNYVALVGGGLFVVFFGIAAIIVIPRFGAVGSGFSPLAVILFSLWLSYGFLRLPLYVVSALCVGFSVIVIAGSHTDMSEPGLVRMYMYVIATNVLGMLLCHSIESRERELFRQRRRAETAQAELDRRAIAAEEANMEKTRLLAAVSHDLRQPMAAAQAYMTVLKGRLQKQDFEKAERQAANLGNSIQMLSTTLDHLLTAARYDSGTEPIRVESVELSPLLARVEETFGLDAARRGIQLRVRLPKQRIVLTTDATALWRVLMNLVSNAIKFTDSDGRAGRGVVVRTLVRDGMCRIDVVDNGIGIAGTHLSAIWEPYFQVANSERNRERGLGLGLFLVRRAVDHLPGHRMTVRSQVGHGSRFSVFVPGVVISEPDFLISARVALEAQELDILQGAHVVLIEDDPDARNALQELMSEWSVVFTSGAVLEDILAQLRDSARTVDCIVSDYRLPGPHNGGECVVVLRKCLEMEVPAIIVTGESDHTRIRQVLPADTVLLQKPFEADALARPLIEAVRLARAREAAL